MPTSFPRSIDVNVQISKVQQETTTDLSVVMGVVKDAPFDNGPGRVRFYDSIAAVTEDFATSTEAYAMANAFFSQAPRAKTFAVGTAFTTDQAGFMKGGALGPITAFTPLADGEFAISIDGASEDITGLDFTLDTDLDDVAATIQTALQLVATGGYTLATAINDNGVLRITSGTSGDGSTVTVLSTLAVPTGTDISGIGFLNAQLGVATTIDGYTIVDLTDELTRIASAVDSSGLFVYAWTLERSYRDTADQVLASNFAQALNIIMGLVSNSPTALDSGSTTDIGFVTNASDAQRTFNLYSSSPDEYPEVALISYGLHVNYAAANSVITYKFKTIVGITPEDITETELNTLETKRYNVLIRVGNVARTTREGVMASNTFYMDERINLDNYAEEVQTAVYNVFLREKRVGYTPGGVALLRNAIRSISNRYETNGTFSDRQVEDITREAGFRIDPAVSITNPPVSSMSAADRADRVGPPFTVEANLTGAIHSVSILINAFA